MRERGAALGDATILDVPTAKSDVGERIRLRRSSIIVDKKTGRGWTHAPMSLRDVETRTANLEVLNPAKFGRYSRTTQLNIEQRGADYLLYELESERKVLALIETLYEGNIAWFERDTGVSFSQIRGSRRQVRHWGEGNRRWGTGATPFLRDPLLPAEFVFEAISPDMSPILIPGQLLGAVVPLYPEDVHNQVVVINHPERGLIAALARDEITYAQLDRAVEGASYEHVVGVAHWIGRRPV